MGCRTRKRQRKKNPRMTTNHLLTITAIISGTMYSRAPVSSNMITTNDTVGAAADGREMRAGLKQAKGVTF